jgi:cyanophycinase
MSLTRVDADGKGQALIALVGGNEFRRDCEPMDRALLARLGSNPSVVIAPTAAARENPRRAAENGMRYFRRLGARAEATLIVDRKSADDPAHIEPLRKADLVYFTGGDPNHLLDSIRETVAWQAVQQALNEGRALAGSSAGAMILGGRMWSPGNGWREGLGLVPHIAVVPHHVTLAARWRIEHLRATLAQDFALIGIDEATALTGLDGKWQALGSGQVVVYHNGTTSAFTNGQSLDL